MFKTGLEPLVEKVAAMDKEAIGQRQVARMQKALAAMPEVGRGSLPPGEGHGWIAALRHLTPERFQSDFDPRWVQKAFEETFSPVYSDRREMSRADRKAGVKYLPSNGEVGRDVAQMERVLTSGRHKTTDVVDVPFVDSPSKAHRQTGVYPDRVAWRGSASSADLGVGPRWTSALPSVAGGYSHEDPASTRLTAYNLSSIPDGAQGPWTPHIATDPRRLDPTERANRVARGRRDGHMNSSEVGKSPIYEKVIDADSLTTPLARYKPLPTPGRFQRVLGPNVLRGEGVADIPPHTPTVAQLVQDAPDLVKALHLTPPLGQQAAQVAGLGQQAAQVAGLGTRLRSAAGSAFKHPYALPIAGGAALLGGLGLYAHHRNRES